MDEKSPGGQRNASDTPDGNKDKFAWFYAMNADPTVSIAAKAVGGVCVMKLAGRKGHFKATYKFIANLCGTSQRTVRRALADLIDKRYLHADICEGSASTYYLNPPVQRLQVWLDAEWDYKHDIERWLNAECNYEREIDQWLFAENFHKKKKFQDAIYAAAIARGANPDLARRTADLFLNKYLEHGYELDPVDGVEAINSLQPEVFGEST